MPKGPAISRVSRPYCTAGRCWGHCALIRVCLVTGPNGKRFYSMSLVPIPDSRLVALAFRKQIRNDFPRKCHTIGISECWSHIPPSIIDEG
jgi:hypothetical protein